MGSIRAIFEALEASVAIEVARPENVDGSGGTSFPVDILVGDEYIDKLQDMTRGRVVLAVGDGTFGGPKNMNARLRSLATWTPSFEAHLWVPAGAVGVRTSILRFDAIEALVKCVARAIYADEHGANIPERPLADSLQMARDPKQLRHGQAAILFFGVAIPITVGRTLTTLPAGARLQVTTNVNPS